MTNDEFCVQIFDNLAQSILGRQGFRATVEIMAGVTFTSASWVTNDCSIRGLIPVLPWSFPRYDSGSPVSHNIQVLS